jgi:putative ABC transport system substrate-binding protein
MAKQKVTMKKIGFLNSASSKELAAPVAAFHQGLKQAGFVDKRNAQVINQYAKHDLKALPRLADKLIDAGVDVLAATGGVASAQAAVDAVRKSGKPIRVVYVAGFDPDNVDLPGGKATGVRTSTTDRLSERLKFASKLLGGKRLAMLVRANTAVGASEKSHFAKRGGEAPILEAETLKDLKARFAEAKSKDLALVFSADSFFTSNRKQIVALAKAQNVPAVYAFRDFVDAGGLMSFGPNLSNAYRQAGVLVGQILGDARARPTVPENDCFEIAINLKAAKAHGIDAGELLAHANHVVG